MNLLLFDKCDFGNENFADGIKETETDKYNFISMRKLSRNFSSFESLLDIEEKSNLKNDYLKAASSGEMKNSCYFSALESDCEDLAKNFTLKMMFTPIFNESIHERNNTKSEKQLELEFNKYSQSKSKLINCSGIIEMLRDKNVLRENSVTRIFTSFETKIRKRDVENAYNAVRMRHERKITFEAFKKVLSIVGTKLYPELNAKQSYELIKQIVTKRNKPQC